MNKNEVQDLTRASQRAAEQKELFLKRLAAKIRTAKRSPLSFSQERIWTITQLNPENTSFNISHSIYINGELDEAVLEKSLSEMINRQEILRTLFLVENERPVQVALPMFSFRLKVIDGTAIATDNAALEQTIGSERTEPFDLQKDLPFRAVLLKLAPRKSILLLVLHQIIFDAECWPIVIQELGSIYPAIKQEIKPTVPSLTMQYADYAGWQRERFQGESYTRLKEYWFNKYQEAVTLLQLPTDRVPNNQIGQMPVAQAGAAVNAKTYQFQITPELLSRLKALAGQEKVSLFVTLLAAFNCLLYMYTLQEQFLIFTSVSAKNRPELMPLIGLFSNLVPLQVKLTRRQNFNQTLKSIQQEVNDAVAHQDLPFDKIIESIKLKLPEPQVKLASLFQVMFTFRYEEAFEYQLGDIRLEPLELELERELNFQLHLWLIEKAGRIEGALSYNEALFEASTIEQIIRHYLELLEMSLKSGDQPLAELPVMQPVRLHSELLAKKRASETQDGTITPYEAPGDEVETKLAALWQEILGTEKVGIHHNFFELGGHSLNAGKLLALINKEFNTALSLTHLFDHPTIHLLADYLKSSAPKNAYLEIKPLAKQEKYPLSYAQKRMYILNQLEKGTNYNISNAMIIEGPIHRLKLEEALKKLMRRHDSLRTRFDTVQGQLVQIIAAEVDFTIEYVEAHETELDDIITTSIRPFDLAQAPLFRMTLIQINPNKHAVVFDMHHIISDGTSMSILITEFVSIYNGQKPADFKAKYVDYVAWQNELYNSETIKREEQYWLNQFQGDIPRLQLPVDFPYSTADSNEGDSVKLIIDRDLYAGLKSLALKTNTTLYTVLLSAYYVFFWKITGQEDIILGTPVTGRSHPDLQNIVGFFLNTLAIRNYPKPAESYLTLLEQVRLSVLNAYENQNYQFEDLLEKLNINSNQNPLFNVWINLPFFQNKAYLKALSQELSIEFYDIKVKHTKSDLLYFITEDDDDRLDINLIYKTKLFKQATIEYFQAEFNSLLRQIALNPDSALKDYQLFVIKHDQINRMNENDPPRAQDKYFRGAINQSIPQRFEEIVQQHGAQIAVSAKGGQLTYEQLNQLANKTARNILEVSEDEYQLTQSEKIRYKRQLLIDGWGIAEQEKLKSTTVFVAGAGGSGSPLIMQLALCGFGTIIVADFDTIDLSNLNRQVLHNQSRIGMNKALSAQMTVQDINPNVKIIPVTERITRENVFEMVHDAAMILDNVDDLETKFILSECAVTQKIPHIISSMIDISSYVAIFHSPITPCFHCLYDVNKLHEIQEMLSLAKNYTKVSNPVASPSLFASTGFACNEAIKILLGLENIAYNKYIFFNQKGSERISQTDGYKIITYPFSEHFKKISQRQGFDWEIGYNGNLLVELTIEKDPDCPLCGKNAKIPAENIKVSQNKTYHIPVEPENLKDNLTENNAKGGSIALLFQHDANMIIGVIGVLKTGKAYIPLDPSLPEERLRYILEDTEARVIVTDNQCLKAAKKLKEKANHNIQIINVDILPGHLADENLGFSISPDQLAYLLYTSGSTGKPKGVAQTHRNVLYYTQNYANLLGLTATDRMTLLSTLAHDAAVVDVFSCLLSGATLYPFNLKEGAADLESWLNTQRITIYHSIPTVYRHLMNCREQPTKFPDVRLVVLGGEQVLPKDISDYQANFDDDCIFVSLLGSSEASITMLKFFDKNAAGFSQTVSLGNPLPEMEVRVLDETGQEVSVYGVGEIVYRGDYLALGYLNLPEKTRQVFRTDPVTGRRVYHSGDLGKVLPNGAIQFMGRNDFQVKIRGYRIEPGEIETQLLKHPNIKEAVIIARENTGVSRETVGVARENTGLAREINDGAGAKNLYAYIVSDRELVVSELREYIARDLPDYMIPAYFIQLEKMPLTPNGKVDRKALADSSKYPGLEGNLKTGAEYEAPRNELEAKLAGVWRQVLQIEKAGIHDEFFVLGGDSMKALLVVAEAEKQAIQISITDIFRHKTIANLIENLAPHQKETPVQGIEEASATAATEIIAPREQEPFETAKAETLAAPVKVQSETTQAEIQIPGGVVESETSRAENAASQLEEALENANGEKVVRVESRFRSFIVNQGDIPEIKELKMVIQRDINVYLHRILPLCVVLTDPNLHPWYFERFWSIFSSTDQKGYLTLEYLEYYGAYREVIGDSSFSADLMEKETDIIQFIIEKINREYYINIAVDEYYLPGKKKYHKVHYIHFALVYGYNNLKQTLNVVGFDVGGILTELTFSYNAFSEAYEQGKRFYEESAPWASMTAVQLFYNVGFKDVYPFDIHKMLRGLHNYLFSVKDEGIVHCWSFNIEQITYGFAVYEVVIKHLEKCLQGQFTIDYRAIHLLAEHKKVIAQRLSYISNRYPMNQRFHDLYGAFLKVVEEFNDLRLKFFDLQFDFSAAKIFRSKKTLGMAIRQVIDMIKTAKEKERAILTEMYELLTEFTAKKLG